MRFFTLVLAATATASWVKRDAATVQSDIQDIASKAQTVQTEVQNYQGGANGALLIYQDSQTLDQAVKKAVTDTTASSAFSSQESADLANAITGLQSQVYGSLNALVSKKTLLLQAVPGANIAQLVQQTLIQLKSDTDAFGGNLTARLTPELQRLAPLVTGDIDFHFNRAIEAFASNSTS